MSPTEIFSSNGEEISKKGQVTFWNGPNSCQNPEIETFTGRLSIRRGSGDIHPLKRYYLQNLGGRIVQGNEKEVLADTGLSRQLFYQLKTGRTEYAKHWRVMYYEEKGIRKCIQLRGSKRKYIIFFRDGGGVIKRTRIEFARLTGLDRNFIYKRIRKGQKIEGWNYEARII
jgi:predicted DNA-binding transcriptional regulator AlpA